MGPSKPPRCPIVPKGVRPLLGRPQLPSEAPLGSVDAVGGIIIILLLTKIIVKKGREEKSRGEKRREDKCKRSAAEERRDQRVNEKSGERVP